MHQKTKKSAFVGEALAEKGKIMQESSASESDVRFPGEESGAAAESSAARDRAALAESTERDRASRTESPESKHTPDAKKRSTPNPPANEYGA